ncbi:unnamed protein product, partial [Mesorhabditis belari]|uniref:Uncharacterized protein n=1 Tax=Mesorhabditis belari TaxID=2138241 RepID=A0AAF3FHB5_9BILA
MPPESSFITNHRGSMVVGLMKASSPISSPITMASHFDHSHHLQQSPQQQYAVTKCKEALRDHEEDVSALAYRGEKHKVVVLGSSGVGKTSLIYRHKFGEINVPFNATIGASFVTCDMDVKGEQSQLQIWDTAGQERFRSMVPMYMRNAAAAILVYDITNRASFEDIDRWYLELSRICGQAEPIIVLVGNKSDLDAKRQVMYGEGVTKALKMGARFYEASMYQENAIEQLLNDLVVDIRCTDDGEMSRAETVILGDDEEMKVDERRRLFGCCSI